MQFPDWPLLYESNDEAGALALQLIVVSFTVANTAGGAGITVIERDEVIVLPQLSVKDHDSV